MGYSRVMENVASAGFINSIQLWLVNLPFIPQFSLVLITLLALLIPVIGAISRFFIVCMEKNSR